MNVIETGRLGKGYRRKWALRGWALIIPGGRLVALVGPVAVLLGACIGAPLLAREVERGTFRFVWTQGAGRTLFAHSHWLTRRGYTLWQSVQPDSRFWPFQLIDGGWVLVASGALIAGSVWLVRRRGA